MNELPNEGVLLEAYEAYCEQSNYPEVLEEGHLGRLMQLAPTEDALQEQVCMGMHRVREVILKTDQTRLIKVPAWVQATPRAVIALDQLMYALDYWRGDQILELLTRISNLIDVSNQLSPHDGEAFCRIELHYIRIFLWEVLRPE